MYTLVYLLVYLYVTQNEDICTTTQISIRIIKSIPQVKVLI